MRKLIPAIRLTVGMAVIMTIASPLSTAAQPDRRLADLRAALEPLLRGPGEYAIAFKDIQSGDELFLNAEALMHAASTMKVPVMIEVFRQAELGRFAMNDSLPVHNQFKSLIDGRPYSIELPDSPEDLTTGALGRRLPIRQLVLQMITVSSNLATNLLIERVGAENVQATMRKLGAERIMILRGVEDPFAYEAGLNNITSARDLLVILEAISEHRIVTPAACEEMIAIMLQQKFNQKLPAQLPPEVRVAHKTGSITRIDHDAGIIFLPDGRRYLLVALSRGIADQTKSSAVIATISRLIYEWMMKNKF